MTHRLRALALLFLIVVAGCVPTRPPSTPAPPSTSPVTVIVRHQGADVETASVWIGNRGPLLTGRDGHTTFAIPDTWREEGLRVEKDGCLVYAATIDVSAPGPFDVSLECGPPPIVSPRAGTVRSEGKQFVDDGGHYFAIGASFFALPWAVANDEPRAIRELEVLARAGADHVRLCTAVGEHGTPDADSWFDRTIDPRDPNLPSVMRRTFDLLRERKMRASVVLACDRVPSLRLDEALFAHADAMLNLADEYRDVVLYVAPTNEGVGFEGDDDPILPRIIEKIRARGFLAAHVSDVDAAPADVYAVHPDRDVTGDGGPWEYVEQVYDQRGSPRLVVFQEPIGPQSSVRSDDDPTRQVTMAAMAMVTRATAVVWHAGAGIRFGGAADLNRPGIPGQGDPHAGNFRRFANFSEQPTLEATWERYRAVRDLLPPMANWTNISHSNPRFQDRYPFDTGPLQPFDPTRWFLKTYANHNGVEFAGVFAFAQKPLPLRALRAMTFTVLNVRTLEKTEHTLNAGDTHVVPISEPTGIVYYGRWQ